jgi:hypothetical protein
MHAALRALLPLALAAFVWARIKARAWLLAVAALLPTIVLRIDHVSPRGACVLPIYHALFRWRRWPRDSGDILDDPHGLYAIEAWNAATQTRETYLIHPHHLRQALHPEAPAALWAYNDAGLVHYIHKHIEKHGREFPFCDVAIADAPAKHELKPVLKCLSMPENVTAGALATWHAWRAGGLPGDVTVTDHDLNETTLNDDEYMSK